MPLLLTAAIALSYVSGQAPDRLIGSGTIALPVRSLDDLALPAGRLGSIRDIRHVATVGATIWTVRDGQYVGDGYLPQYATVFVLGPSSNPDFVTVLLPGGQPAIVSAAALARGDGTAARAKLCHDAITEQPLHNGEILRKRQSGPNRVVVTNNGSDEAVVKFRSQDGVATVALFVGGQSQAAVENFPDGVYQVEFATGLKWSRKCGLFEQGMYAQRFRALETFASRELVEVKQGKHVRVVRPEFAEFTVPPDRDGSAIADPVDEEAFIRD